MKTGFIAITALCLGAMPALAQTTTTPPAEKMAPGATVTTTPAGGHWYSHQATEMRASKLIGTNVKNAANETVGEINELVLDPQGRVQAAVIGVGGFLGIGEREVAVDFKALRMSKDSSGNNVVTMDATKDSLKSAPEWKWQSTSSTDSSTGTSGTTGTTTRK